jgi:membrane protease YdiL (CAAX protease family)
MVAFSLITMLMIPGYTLTNFGFKKPEKVNYFKIIWLTFVFVVGGMILFGFLYLGVLENIFGKGSADSGGFDDVNQSIFHTILSIWIWSSFTEEFYMRGFFQSLLDNLKKIRFINLSAPVWISGIAFGLIHLSLYTGDNLFFTLFIVTQAMIMGTLAAYYREKTNSIYPAILVHVLANFYGSIPLLFQ